MIARRLLAASLAAVLLAGCPAANPALPPKKGATPKPTTPKDGPASPGVGPFASMAPLLAGEIRLTGKVKLISDKGASIISNNGGTIVANNGGGVIANNGAGVIANNGAGYALLAKAPESLLADAEIRFEDAAGKPVAGKDGRPVVAKTDRQGGFGLQAALPPGNLVMKVKLWDGGELSALLVRAADAREVAQDVDTASSLGAAFVLGRLVKGDQALLDKVPAAEARRLATELEASRELLAARPTYSAEGLAAAADDLRKKAPQVDEAIKVIEALLLGQKNLGDGEPATSVPLNRPFGAVAAPDGTVTLAEGGLGRLRRISPDGRISTYADAVRGVVKKNFVGVRDLLRLADGSLLVGSMGDRQVWKIGPDDKPTSLYTCDSGIDFAPWTIARTADGTLYVGGKRRHPENGMRAPHWVAVAPDGAARELPLVGKGGNGTLAAVLAAPEGGVYVLRVVDEADPAVGYVYHVPPVGEPRLVADGLSVKEDSDLQIAPDGTLYVSESAGGRVTAIAKDGTKTPLAGAGVAGSPPLVTPTGLGVGPDGTLYVSDGGTSRVFARDPKGAWRALAGVDTDAPLPDGDALPLNSPAGLAFDAQGRLLITENGRHRVVRYADGRLEPVAGSTQGRYVEGVPALEARFSGVTGIAARGAELAVVDAFNQRLRVLGADGLVRSVAGGDLGDPDPAARSYPASAARLQGALGVAYAPDGRLYWVNPRFQQLQRLAKPDLVEAVAGVAPAKDAPQASFDAVLADKLIDGEPAATAVFRMPTAVAFDPKGDGKSCFVTDSAHMQVRRVSGLDTPNPTIEAWVGRGPASLAALFGGASALVGTGNRLAVDVVVPGGLCFDPQGNLYVGEMGTARLDFLGALAGIDLDTSALPPIPPSIKKIAPDGTVTVLAGPGGKFFPDPDAEDALVMPTAIAYAPDGRLVIADPGANLVRILPAGSF